MKSNSLPLLIFHLLLIHFHQSLALLDPATLDESYAAAPTAAQSPESDDVTQFIRTSCQSTLYKDLCFNSLIFYANIIQHDSARLTRIAIKLSITRAKSMANYLSYLSSQAESGALHDCYSVFGDAVDQMKDSLKQMQQLNSSGGSLRFKMSNVQTWLSAAMTNEDTCTDGLSDLPNGVIKDDVIDRVNKALHVTSNALALVNRFVTQVAKP